MEEIEKHRVRCLRHGIANLAELRGVEKSYGEVKVLHPTDLTLKCGEVFSLVEFETATKIISEPAHPYTRLLLESAGGMHSRLKRTGQEKAHPPGCPFVSRCSRVGERCKREKPLPREERDRYVACYFPLEKTSS